MIIGTVVSTAGCSVIVVVTHVQTHVFTQLLRVLYAHLHPNNTINTAGPNGILPTQVILSSDL